MRPRQVACLPMVIGGLGENEFTHGAAVSVDGSNMDKAKFAGARHLDPGYVWVEAFSKAERSKPRWYLPAFFFPQQEGKVSGETSSEEEARRLRNRSLLREALAVAFMAFDGVTRHAYTVKGVTRYAVFGLQTLVLDGAEQVAFSLLRQFGSTPCPRCLVPEGLFPAIGSACLPEFLKSKGLHGECILNPMRRVFGCSHPDWIVGRNMAYARLHHNELGGLQQTLRLAYQAPQRLRESDGEVAKADSPAAAAADVIYAKLELAIRELVALIPSSCTHSRWKKFTFHFTRYDGSQRSGKTYADFHACNAWHMRDLLVFSIPALLQPFVFCEDDVRGAQYFGHWCVEPLCLYLAFYRWQAPAQTDRRDRVEIKMLARMDRSDLIAPPKVLACL